MRLYRSFPPAARQHGHWLAGLAFAALALHLVPAQAQQTSVQDVQKGRCPTNFELRTTGNPAYAYCRRTTTQTVAQFASPPYRPCLPPGQYNSNDEVPSGSLRGRDRCTVLGGVGTGPGLPCPPAYPLLQVRQGQVDRCYRNTQQSTTTYSNLQLFQ